MVNELLQQADRVVARASDTQTLLGVFIIGEKLKATRTTTVVFQTGCRDYPHRLVGVYNGDANPRRIVEDAQETLKSAGKVS